MAETAFQHLVNHIVKSGTQAHDAYYQFTSIADFFNDDICCYQLPGAGINTCVLCGGKGRRDFFPVLQYAAVLREFDAQA